MLYLRGARPRIRRSNLPTVVPSIRLNMPFSHHSHSGQFCGHAKDTLEEVVETAISKQMDLYALTEHMPRDDEDLYPEEVTALSAFHVLQLTRCS